MAKKTKDLYQGITDRVLKSMEDGVAPWHRPWKSVGASRNALTGKPYRGINVILTMVTAWNRGYSDPRWLTFKQANEIAGRAMKAEGHKVEQHPKFKSWIFAEGPNKGKSVGGIRKGQSAANGCGATGIIFWKPVKKTEKNEKGDEVDRSFLIMREYQVFNVEQCDEHVQKYLGPVVMPHEFSPIEAAESVCKGYDIDVRYGGDRAFYACLGDFIQLPPREAFDSPEEYYSTMFHEMGHSTGASHRLARKGIEKFDFKGSHQYAEEELVAEFTACFLAGEVGIERTFDNSASYLRHWASKIQDDKTLIVRVTQQAQKAADLILGRLAVSDADVDADAA